MKTRLEDLGVRFGADRGDEEGVPKLTPHDQQAWETTAAAMAVERELIKYLTYGMPAPSSYDDLLDRYRTYEAD